MKLSAEFKEPKKMNIKKIVARGRCGKILLSLLCFILIGCNKIEQSYSKQERVQRYFEFLYRESSQLLALKYKIDENKVFKILTSDDATYNLDRAIRNAKDLKERVLGIGLKERIEQYSQQLNIPINIIASVLFDFKKAEPMLHEAYEKKKWEECKKNLNEIYGIK